MKLLIEQNEDMLTSSSEWSYLSLQLYHRVLGVFGYRSTIMVRWEPPCRSLLSPCSFSADKSVVLTTLSLHLQRHGRPVVSTSSILEQIDCAEDAVLGRNGLCNKISIRLVLFKLTPAFPLSPDPKMPLNRVRRHLLAHFPRAHLNIFLLHSDMHSLCHGNWELPKLEGKGYLLYKD